MPTIDIPDKICSHCGGIRWCMFQKKDWRLAKFYGKIKYYTDYTCANNNENGCALLKRLKYYPLKPKVKVTKEHTRNRVNEYHKKNKHKWISQSKESHKKYVKKLYHSDPKYKKRLNESARKYGVELTDSYVKKAIVSKNPFLSVKDVPQDLVEMKRNQLLLKRKIKNNDKEEQHSN
jgi:hypothetical protein